MLHMRRASTGKRVRAEGTAPASSKMPKILPTVSEEDEYNDTYRAQLKARVDADKGKDGSPRSSDLTTAMRRRIRRELPASDGV